MKPRRSAGPLPRARGWLVPPTIIAAGVLAVGTVITAPAFLPAARADTPTSITVQPGGCGDTSDGVSPFVRVRATHPGEFALVVQGEPHGPFTDLADTGFPVTAGAVRVDLIPEEGSGVSGSTSVAPCTSPGTSTPTPTRTSTPSPTAGTTATPTRQATPAPSSTPSAAPTTPSASTAAGAERSGGLASTGGADYPTPEQHHDDLDPHA